MPSYTRIWHRPLKISSILLGRGRNPKKRKNLGKTKKNKDTQKKIVPDSLERGGLDKSFVVFLFSNVFFCFSVFPMCFFVFSLFLCFPACCTVRSTRFAGTNFSKARSVTKGKQYCIFFKETCIKACHTVLKEYNDFLKCNCLLKNTFSK